MNSGEMFEFAVRNKFRFLFKGLITVEDLWDLSVENLDSIFKTLNSQLKQTKEESLLQTKTQEDKEIDIKIEIIKYIVGTKIAEENLRSNAKNQKIVEQKILGIIAEKENEDLRNKSVDELKDMLNKLEK